MVVSHNVSGLEFSSLVEKDPYELMQEEDDTCSNDDKLGDQSNEESESVDVDCINLQEDDQLKQKASEEENLDSEFRYEEKESFANLQEVKSCLLISSQHNTSTSFEGGDFETRLDREGSNGLDGYIQIQKQSFNHKPSSLILFNEEFNFKEQDRANYDGSKDSSYSRNESFISMEERKGQILLLKEEAKDEEHHRAIKSSSQDHPQSSLNGEAYNFFNQDVDITLVNIQQKLWLLQKLAALSVEESIMLYEYEKLFVEEIEACLIQKGFTDVALDNNEDHLQKFLEYDLPNATWKNFRGEPKIMSKVMISNIILFIEMELPKDSQDFMFKKFTSFDGVVGVKGNGDVSVNLIHGDKILHKYPNSRNEVRISEGGIHVVYDNEGQNIVEQGKYIFMSECQSYANEIDKEEQYWFTSGAMEVCTKEECFNNLLPSIVISIIDSTPISFSIISNWHQVERDEITSCYLMTGNDINGAIQPNFEDITSDGSRACHILKLHQISSSRWVPKEPYKVFLVPQFYEETDYKFWCQEVYKLFGNTTFIIWNWFYKDFIEVLERIHPGCWKREWKIAWFEWISNYHFFQTSWKKHEFRVLFV